MTIPSIDSIEKAFLTKAEILVNGIYIDQPILRGLSDFKERVITLYAPDEYNYQSSLPHEVKLMEVNNEAIAVTLRTTTDPTGWQLTMKDNNLVIKKGPTVFCVNTLPKPKFYDSSISDGTPVKNQVAKVGTDALGVIMSSFCAYFRNGNECRFCEIEPTYFATQTTPPVKKIEKIAECIVKAVDSGEEIKHLLLNGGNLPSYDGTVRMYLRLLKELNEYGVLKKMSSYGIMMPPNDFTLIDELYNNGLEHIAFNLEIWNKELYPLVVPGKSSFGYDKMRLALRYAVKLFGEAKVYSGFIYGLQSYDNLLATGQFDPSLENQRCYEILSLIREGVVPLFQIYHTSNRNKTGQIRLSYPHAVDFHIAYGVAMKESGMIRYKQSVGLGLGTVSNHLYNDAYCLAIHSDVPEYGALPEIAC